MDLTPGQQVERFYDTMMAIQDALWPVLGILKTSLWVKHENAAFGGRTGAQAIRDGDGELVLARARFVAASARGDG